MEASSVRGYSLRDLSDYNLFSEDLAWRWGRERETERDRETERGERDRERKCGERERERESEADELMSQKKKIPFIESFLSCRCAEPLSEARNTTVK